MVETISSTQPAQCNRSLYLLLDESGSMQDGGWTVQIDATAEAIAHPDNIALMLKDGGIAIKVGFFDDELRPITPWRLIASTEDALQLAADIAAQRDHKPTGNSEIGQAVSMAFGDFLSSPCHPTHQTIDVSTDGEDNTHQLEGARDEAVAAGIRINTIGIFSTASDDSFAGTNHKTPEAMHDALRHHLQTYDGFSFVANFDTYADEFHKKFQVDLIGDARDFAPNLAFPAPNPSITR